MPSHLFQASLLWFKVWNALNICVGSSLLMEIASLYWKGSLIWWELDQSSSHSWILLIHYLVSWRCALLECQWTNGQYLFWNSQTLSRKLGRGSTTDSNFKLIVKIDFLTEICSVTLNCKHHQKFSLEILLWSLLCPQSDHTSFGRNGHAFSFEGNALALPPPPSRSCISFKTSSMSIPASAGVVWFRGIKVITVTFCSRIFPMMLHLK